MNAPFKTLTAVALATAIGLAAVPASAEWGRHHDDDRCGPGIGVAGWAGPERGGRDHARFRTDRNFTADQIRILAEAHLLMQGNENLKVGKVAATDRGTFAVDIVTRNDSLVETVEISKATGFPVGRR